MDLKQALVTGRARIKAAHDQQQVNLDSVFAKAATALEVWNKTGIVGVSETDEEQFKGWLGINGFVSRLREEARAADRPFLTAKSRQVTKYYINGSITRHFLHLTTPNTTRLNPLVASLLLLSTEIPCNGQSLDGISATARVADALGSVPVVRINTPQRWHFYFNEDAKTKGPLIFKQFAEQCRTDPVFRVILRLP